MQELRENIQPFFMYGTAWKEDETEKLTMMALQSGFRAIDTANQRKHYFEEGVGNGIAKFLEKEDFTRDDLFLQTKFTYKEGQDHRLPYDPKASFSDQVRQSFQSSLDHLRTDYIDSYVLHGPSTGMGLNKKDYEVWHAMEMLHEENLTRYIGVSNINAMQLELLLDHAEINPSFVQNRCFAQNGWDKHVRTICREHNIIYQGFSLLTANRNYLTAPKIRDIAENHDVTIPAVIFAFAAQIGMLPLTGTRSRDHMELDLDALGIVLDDKELELIEAIAM